MRGHCSKMQRHEMDKQQAVHYRPVGISHDIQKEWAPQLQVLLLGT
jgi:hypothetical protein